MMIASAPVLYRRGLDYGLKWIIRIRNSSISYSKNSVKMAGVTLKFSNNLSQSNPPKESVLIITHKSTLPALDYEELSVKFGSKVPKELFETAVDNLKNTSSNGVEIVPLYMKDVTLARLPSSCSRHNTPSQAHALTKLVKHNTSSKDESIVVICEHRNLFASACSIGRSFPLYIRKKNGTSRTVTVEFLVVDSETNKRTSLNDSDLNCLTSSAESVRLSAKIVDMPCCEMNTDAFLEEINKVGDALGIKPEVIRGEELAKRGFGGLYSVGKAAEHPPALAILSHTVPEAKETIAWVGKGIVYDTGGLFLKGRNGMPGMKRDCGGAAGILGAFYLAVKMGFKENLHALFCLAENAIGPKATRPDDIITLYSGKTVEISNPDAEGRLVLGDGVAYAKKDLNATIILDMATLTGAQGIATGRYHGALVTNDEDMEKLAVQAGRISGDLIHPMLYTPEMHFSEYNSSLADMKNSVSDSSNASVTCGGLFVGFHLGFDYSGKWLHVDMAKPSHTGERATGYGVALLNALFGYASRNSFLQQLAHCFEGGDGNVKINK